MFDAAPLSSDDVATQNTATSNTNIKTTLAWLNTCLTAIERTAWQLNAFVGNTQAGWQWTADETRHWWQRAAQLPHQTKRLLLCGWMLTRIITSYRLWHTQSAFIPASKRAAALERLHKRSARRFVATSLQQGGAFLKIGQLLSTRSDLLPAAWITELAQLQDQASAEPISSILHSIKQATGKEADTLFAHFDNEPLACASIGQVHRAQLLDGREVAVKVRRAGISQLVNTDMTLLKLFLGNIHALLDGMDIGTISQEIERSIREELDYTREARAMQRIGRHLPKIDGVSCPQVIPELSNHTLLVTTFVEGKKLTDVLDTYQQQGDTERTAQLMHRLLDAWLLQVLQLGFFHADPHPGNLLVTADNQLVLLDFGACQSLSNQAKQGYFRVLQAAIIGQEEEVARVLTELGFRTRSGQPDTLIAFTRALLTQISERLASGDADVWPDETTLHKQAAQLMAHLQQDPVTQLPSDFIMLARVFLSLGGLYSHYRPAVDLSGLILKHLTWPSQAHHKEQ